MRFGDVQVQVPEVRVTAKALLPSTSVISFTLGNGLSFITFVNTVPISANKTINRFCLIRSLAADEATAFAKLNPFFNWAGFDIFARKAMLKWVPFAPIMQTCAPHHLVRR